MMKSVAEFLIEKPEPDYKLLAKSSLMSTLTSQIEDMELMLLMSLQN